MRDRTSHEQHQHHRHRKYGPAPSATLAGVAGGRLRPRSSAAISPRPLSWPRLSAAAPRRESSAPSGRGHGHRGPRYANVVPVVTRTETPSAGKAIVDICNPVNAAADGLATPDGTSSARKSPRRDPASATRGGGLQHHLRCCPGQGPTAGRSSSPGDDAKARRAWRSHRQPQAAPTRRRRLGRPWRGKDGSVMIGLAQHGVGSFDFALDVTVPD